MSDRHFSQCPLGNFPDEPHPATVRLAQIALDEAARRNEELDEREQEIQVRDSHSWSFFIGACLLLLASLVAGIAMVITLNERLPR